MATRWGIGDVMPLACHGPHFSCAYPVLGSRLNAANNRSEIEVVKSYGSLPLVECYPGQLNQVFMNILTNAIDAIDEKFLSALQQAAAQSVTVGCIQITTTLLPNHRVSILIADNGKGIPQPILNKIFEPFFTTKSWVRAPVWGYPLAIK
jgi:signal transduction histidine kinase